jgi:hypothetical protein
MWKEKPLTPRKTPLPQDDTGTFVKRASSTGKVTYRAKWLERAVANKANFALSDVHLIMVAFREVILDVLREDACLNITGLFKIYHNLKPNTRIHDLVDDKEMPNSDTHQIRIIPSKALLSPFRTDRYGGAYWRRDNEKRSQYLKAYREKLKLKRQEEKRIQEELDRYQQEQEYLKHKPGRKTNKEND